MVRAKAQPDRLFLLDGAGDRAEAWLGTTCGQPDEMVETIATPRDIDQLHFRQALGVGEPDYVIDLPGPPGAQRTMRTLGSASA